MTSADIGEVREFPSRLFSSSSAGIAGNFGKSIKISPVPADRPAVAVKSLQRIGRKKAQKSQKEFRKEVAGINAAQLFLRLLRLFAANLLSLLP